MATKTVYVSDDDTPIWAEVERQAKQRRTSASRIVADALAVYLPQLAAEPPPPSASAQWTVADAA